MPTYIEAKIALDKALDACDNRRAEIYRQGEQIERLALEVVRVRDSVTQKYPESNALNFLEEARMALVREKWSVLDKISDQTRISGRLIKDFERDYIDGDMGE